MQKKILSALLSIVFVLSCLPIAAQAGETFAGYKLSVLDNFNHSSEKFSSILDSISSYHPKYTREKIGNLIISAYFTVKRHHPYISIYKVAEGIKRFSRDSLGIDLETLAYSYILSQS